MVESRTEKEKFFDQLYKLDNLQEGPEDTSRAALLLQESRNRRPKPPVAVRAIVRPALRRAPYDVTKLTPGITRTVSAPLHALGTPRIPIDDEVTVVKDTPIRSIRPTRRTEDLLSLIDSGSIARPHDAYGQRAPTGLPKMLGRRKRTKSLQILPESEQIFKGLSFYFFPNNDIAPARRMRITKALEYGAVWAKEWRVGITHVVVDKNLTFNELLSYLKIRSLPSDIALVNELFPVECISLRILVNPQQGHYQVEGYAEASSSVQSTISAGHSSEVSLPLKPSKGEFVREPQTPSRTEESIEQPSTAHSRRLDSFESLCEPLDSDDAIQDTKSIEAEDSILDNSETEQNARAKTRQPFNKE
ncbi:MAG: hypothetical protein M1827_006474 [Pycnora praestabilis]|nr:MAG: hypothetical protein M1827_006474 [Pycnora praestabilis]